MSKSSKIYFILLLIIFLNVAALWTVYFFGKNNLNGKAPSTMEYQALKQELKLLQTQETEEESTTTQTTLEEIKELKVKIEDLEASLSAITVADENGVEIQQTTIISSDNNIKEHFVYLGTGNTTSREWTNIDATAAIIDTANYKNVKAVYFEAASSIIGGEVHIRLANKTTGGIFNDSELFNNSTSTVWKTSNKISLDRGRNEYIVQLRSTSGEKANLDGARIRIIVE